MLRLAWRHKNMLCQSAKELAAEWKLIRSTVSAVTHAGQSQSSAADRARSGHTQISRLPADMWKNAQTWQAMFVRGAGGKVVFTAAAATSRDACCRTWSPIHHSQEADT